MREADLLITGGSVIDGTGSAPFRADVAVGDGQILAVGELGTWHAEEVVDATGRMVCPGFIDAHAHDDVAVLDQPEMTAKLSQGVTTVVAGNCGVSLAPVAPTGPLPPPFPVLADDEAFRYPTVAAYKKAVAAARPAVNLALLVGHSTLRLDAMADLNRAATVDETAAMVQAARRALGEGCVGVSSGVDYPCAGAAEMDELVAVASATNGFDGAVYTAHVRDEGDEILAALDEAITTAEAAGTSLVLSHHKCAGPANYGRSRETLARIDAAPHAHLDVYPYTASASSLLLDFVADAERVTVSWSKPHPELAGLDLDEIATGWAVERAEAVERLSPAGAIYFQMHDDDVDRIVAHPRAMIGSDGLPGRGRPHPRLWGTFPRVLGHYARDRSVLGLVEAVHKMTGLPARIFALGHRGVVEPGAIADLVVFDPATVADRATFDEPEQPAAGVDTVVVGGRIAWAGGHVGSRAGQFLEREVRT